MIASLFSDPSCQKWTERERSVTPQQNNFKSAYATRLACGIYAVLNSMYAVREWSIDFVEQSHINNARNWMAAVGHEIKETVSLERCKCGSRYEQWGRQPAPPCSKCEKIHVRKASSGETGIEQGGSEGKQTKCDSSNGICERKTEKIQHPRKAVKKIKTQADIRHAFFDPAHGSRENYQLPASTILSKLRSSGKRSTKTPCQWTHVTGAVSKADVTLLQPTVSPFLLVTFRPFS